jgi:hypothetical protein
VEVPADILCFRAAALPKPERCVSEPGAVQMILDEVFAQRADEGERVNSDASCIYLKPIGAPDVSVRELFTTVERLAKKCRCGACFACLREAGSIKWGSPSEPAY